MPASFRKDASYPPPRYRTPPPPRHAFEPISPIGTEDPAIEELNLLWAKNTRTRKDLKRPYYPLHQISHGTREQGKPAGGAMDAFASIALATNLTGLYQLSTFAGTHTLNRHHNPEHASKRARSEDQHPPDWARKSMEADTTPVTSCEQSDESRRLEAELLLNFAQEAAKVNTCWPRPCQIDPERLGIVSEVLPHALPEPSIHASANGQVSYIEREAVEDEHGAWEPGVFPPENTPTHSDLHKPQVDIQNTATPSPPPIPTILEPLDDHTITPELDASDLRSSEAVWHNDLEFQLEAPGQEKDAGNWKGEGSFEPGIQIDDHASDPVDLSDSQDSIVSDQPAARNNALEGPEDAVPINNKTMQEIKDGIERTEGGAIDIAERVETAEDVDIQGQPQDDVVENELSAIHDIQGDDSKRTDGASAASVEDVTQLVPEVGLGLATDGDASIPEDRPPPTIAMAVCAACNFARNSTSIENDNSSTSWISCDGCKSWFHFACAGFKSEREVRSVDKFRCRKCKPLHGSTTYVRKSSRAHSAIDYAGLHEGVIKTSDERPEHHYIKPIKDGTITFLPETFARMRPELLTADFFEKGTGMKEPVVIPACFNPQPKHSSSSHAGGNGEASGVPRPNPLEDDVVAEDWFSHDPESRMVVDQGQDALDMVIPRGLTVRQVAELYGPEEKVEVIDVKSQNGENKKWNMRRWADYYENPNNKVVRNVISLEVSQSKLGRLIRRPQIVRDLDLQDAVWPEELLAKGEYPRVQFYCLMSVADCFTDFHIDFGGSSVFYHILKGKKTFLFIPPKEKHLKKYEDWCMSPAQNWTFLGDQTKECYRVDLLEGDTMLIPAGWIHAVWTPEDSLVIGGNFLTRLNFGMQLRVAQVEKATGVARKFRYPHFQKLHWYTALRYLEDDPLPENIKNMLYSGGNFHREQPAHYNFDAWGENSNPGVENYHARYYSQSELEGLPDLTRYLLRTALIDIGSITDGISAETRNAVKKSIPRGHGEPLDVIKSFAAWCAWKRGNEPIPHWAYPDAVPENLAPDKLSAAATKKLDREAALQAPRRQSARMQSQQEKSERSMAPSNGVEVSQSLNASSLSTSIPPGNVKRLSSDPNVLGQTDSIFSATPKRPKTALGLNTGSHRKTACESCRRRRRACKHKDLVGSSISSTQNSDLEVSPMGLESTPLFDGTPFKSVAAGGLDVSSLSNGPIASHIHSEENIHRSDDQTSLPPTEIEFSVPSIESQTHAELVNSLDPVSGNAMLVRPRHKACNDCRKSKRRCIHDAYGNEDPIKVRETAIPRPHARKINAQSKDGSTVKKLGGSVRFGPSGARKTATGYVDPTPDVVTIEEEVMKPAPIANMIAQPCAFEIQPHKLSILPYNFQRTKHGELTFPELNPALLLQNLSSAGRNKQESSVDSASSRVEEQQQLLMTGLPEQCEEQIEEDIHIVALPSDTNAEATFEEAPFESIDSFTQPAASSLVSPPASSNDDPGTSPNAADAKWSPSASSSRQSSRQPKQTQRYTPESGPMRRASSSSYGENVAEKHGQPITAEPISVQKPSPAKSKSDPMAFENLRLIKELQAQEYGLRRRGGA